MQAATLNYSVNRRIRLLLVDDSELFRKFVAELLADSTALTIAGEAASGEEALEKAARLKPDVILMDMEMPVMDGVEALRRLREEGATPVVMVSSLSREGSARCFDTLKNGAVDFIGKDALHPRKGLEQLKKELLYRIVCAARVKVRRSLPGPAGSPLVSSEQPEQTVLFCEDCGARNVFDSGPGAEALELRCRDCGDLLEPAIITRYRRVSYIGVIGAGKGGAANLLTIVPRLPAETRAAVIVVMQEPPDYVDSLSRYLNAVSLMKVARLEDGANIEGGKCYIASAPDNFAMVSHSTNYTIRKTDQEPGRGALDLMLESVAPILKNRLLALVLSGSQLDGDKGIQQVRENLGYVAVLNAGSCLCKELGEHVLRKSAVDRIVDEGDCVELLMNYHQSLEARLQ